MEWLLAQRFINHPSNQFARGIEYVMNLNLGAQIMQRANQLWPHADVRFYTFFLLITLCAHQTLSTSFI